VEAAGGGVHDEGGAAAGAGRRVSGRGRRGEEQEQRERGTAHAPKDSRSADGIPGWNYTEKVDIL